MDRRKSPSRAGFTLVEVLVAILIIATLVALLLPAVRAAYRKAQEAQVTAELNNMVTALASFKNTYGDYPPSRIILSEEGFNATLARTEFTSNSMIPGFDTNDTDITYPQLAQRSLLYLRRFWPRVDFNGTTHDFNNDGTFGTYYILSGSECLTFFLGGQPINNGNGSFAGSGFSKLPSNPFLGLHLNPTATNRTVPNYEFTSGRLIDLDHDGIPSYMDPLDLNPTNQRAYAYFSSYGTNSYDPNDVNGLGKAFDFAATNTLSDTGDYELEEDQATLVERGFTIGFPASGGGNYVVSTAPNPYTTNTPVQPTTGTMTWINPNSFQLFSCGQDRYWGLGGQYAQNSTGQIGKLPIQPNPPDTGNIHSDDVTNIRRRESDNLTNFSGGRLD
jgi:prepilin-type N-terminal cleavage/methylation domain-containing protein